MTTEDKLLDRLFDQFTDNGVNWDDFQEKDIKIIEESIKHDDRMMKITDESGIEHFFNDAAMDFFYGVESNHMTIPWEIFYGDIIHPDHLDDLQKAAQHWENNADKSYSATLQVKNKRKEWRWTYYISKALNLTKEKRPEYTLSIAHDIEGLIYGVNHKAKQKFILENIKLKDTLTKREVDVLCHIAMEKTSIEISEILSIKPSTVDTHRKNMIKKLGVRSSLGLVRFYLFLEEYENYPNIGIGE